MQTKQNKIKEEGDFKSITVGCVLDYPGYPSRNTKTEWNGTLGSWFWVLKATLKKTTWTTGFIEMWKYKNITLFERESRKQVTREHTIFILSYVCFCISKILKEHKVKIVHSGNSWLVELSVLSLFL